MKISMSVALVAFTFGAADAVAGGLPINGLRSTAAGAPVSAALRPAAAMFARGTPTAGALPGRSNPMAMSVSSQQGALPGLSAAAPEAAPRLKPVKQYRAELEAWANASAAEVGASAGRMQDAAQSAGAEVPNPCGASTHGGCNPSSSYPQELAGAAPAIVAGNADRVGRGFPRVPPAPSPFH